VLAYEEAARQRWKYGENGLMTGVDIVLIILCLVRTFALGGMAWSWRKAA
jgi:hypothetical protein